MVQLSSNISGRQSNVDSPELRGIINTLGVINRGIATEKGLLKTCGDLADKLIKSIRLDPNRPDDFYELNESSARLDACVRKLEQLKNEANSFGESLSLMYTALQANSPGFNPQQFIKNVEVLEVSVSNVQTRLSEAVQEGKAQRDETNTIYNRLKRVYK